MQGITNEGLAQGSYVAARGEVESATFRTEGTDNHHLTNHALKARVKSEIHRERRIKTDRNKV